jgi:hypothetical protein
MSRYLSFVIVVIAFAVVAMREQVSEPLIISSEILCSSMVLGTKL